MKLNKEQFLKTEFGGELECMITAWDDALNRNREDKEALRTLAWCQAQWEVYRMAIKHFYGVEYHFTRTDEYYGLCTEDESDYLMKVDREQVSSSQYKITKEDVKEAMRSAREMEKAAKTYAQSLPADNKSKTAMELVLEQHNKNKSGFTA